jgi:drug/metabolite transporter (DMT)-like permease
MNVLSNFVRRSEANWRIKPFVFWSTFAAAVMRNEGLVLTTAASVLWGTIFVAVAVGLREANAYNLVFLRFLVASVVVGLFGSIFGKLGYIAGELRRKSTWLLGVIWAAGFILQYVGQSLTDASQATLLSNLAPTLVPILAILLLRDVISPYQKAGTVLGFVGLLFFASPLHGSPLGQVVLFSSSITYAFFIVLSKRFDVSSIESAFAILISMTVFAAPVSIVLGGLNPLKLRLDPAEWLAVLYMAVVCTVATSALYFKGLRPVSASQSGALLFVELLTGLVLAVGVMRESLTLPEIVGAGSVLFSVALATLRKKSKARDF